MVNRRAVGGIVGVLALGSLAPVFFNDDETPVAEKEDKKVSDDFRLEAAKALREADRARRFYLLYYVDPQEGFDRERDELIDEVEGVIEARAEEIERAAQDEVDRWGCRNFLGWNSKKYLRDKIRASGQSLRWVYDIKDQEDADLLRKRLRRFMIDPLKIGSHSFLGESLVEARYAELCLNQLDECGDGLLDMYKDYLGERRGDKNCEGALELARAMEFPHEVLEAIMECGNSNDYRGRLERLFGEIELDDGELLVRGASWLTKGDQPRWFNICMRNRRFHGFGIYGAIDAEASCVGDLIRGQYVMDHPERIFRDVENVERVFEMLSSRVGRDFMEARCNIASYLTWFGNEPSVIGGRTFFTPGSYRDACLDLVYSGT